MDQVDALSAADNFRRAAGLLEQAKAQLIEATVRDGAYVRVRSISMRAGLGPDLLYTWIHRNGRKLNGGVKQRAR